MLCLLYVLWSCLGGAFGIFKLDGRSNQSYPVKLRTDLRHEIDI